MRVTLSGVNSPVIKLPLIFLWAALGGACHDQGLGPNTKDFGSWSAKDSMLSPRADLGVAVIDGSLYAVGGYYGVDALGTLEAYNPGTSSWTTKAPMPTPRIGIGVGVVNGILYAVGGFVPFVGNVATVEAYDPVANTWTPKASMPTPRAFLAVGVVNGVLYAVGGSDGSLAQGGPVEAYDPISNSWTTKARMPTSRAFLGVGVINNILYAVGSGVLEAYDPVANSWTTKAPMPTRRSAMGVGVVDGLLFTLGGVPTAGSTSGFMNTVEVYDPATNTWARATSASMLTARSEFGVGVINNALYAIGGYAPLSSNSYGFVATNEVFQPTHP